MRVTMQMLIKSNNDKRVMIFILLGICFVLAVMGSCQYAEIKNLLKVQSNKTGYIVKNTETIVNILTLAVE